MRVTIVSRIYRPEPSAASFFLGAVADELVRRGDDVLVLTARPPRGTPTPPTRERVRTAPVLRDDNGYVRGYLPYLSFDVPVFFRLLVSRRADVVLVEPPPTTGIVVRAACTLRGIPYVYDAADVWSDAADMATTSPLVVRVLRRIERWALRGARALVTISAPVVERVRALGVTRPVEVTGFGADTGSFTYLDRPREAVFVYAGSYSAWHGAEIVLDALALLRRDGVAVRVAFIGNGERELLAARAAELGIADAVDFLPARDPADLVPVLAAASGTVATLRPGTGYEYAFTSKAYSSLAAGCPVVFAGPGPTGPFLQAAAAHVRAGAAVPYDARALAEAMSDLLADPPTAGDRAALAEWTAREHSLAAVAGRVAAVLGATVRDATARDATARRSAR